MQTPKTSQQTAAGTLSALDGLQDLLDAVLATIGSAPASESADQQAAPIRSVPWILSIEDDDDFAKILQVRINEFGWQLLNVKEGRAGYQQAFYETPSAILLDYELPNGNGDDVLRRLKDSAATADIPVIVVSGRHDSEFRREMQALGATDFVGKPVNWVQLRRAIERHMPVAAT